MKKHTLNTILKLDRKNKKSFIKYLSKINYDEFKILLDHYVNVVIRLKIKYNNMPIKIFSKNWFIKRDLQNKYTIISNIFYSSNPIYFNKIANELYQLNMTKVNLYNRLEYNQKLLKNLESTTVIIENNNEETIRNIAIFFLSTLNINNEIKNSIEEINNLSS